MLELKIRPGAGIGPVNLGATRREVRTALAAIDIALRRQSDGLDYFDSIQVEYKSERATFIGVSWSNAYVTTYMGVNVFDVTAESLFSLFATHDASGDHTFNEYEYLFPKQILTLWDADSQYDRIGGEQRVVWAQVGIGNDDYLRAIEKIKG